MRSLAIRGMAVAAPFGGVGDIGEFLRSDKSWLGSWGDPGHEALHEGRCAWAGEAIARAGNVKLRKQTDRSTLLALQCLDDLAEQYDATADGALDQVGVFVASQFGGMDFSEIQLAHLVRHGPRKVSAYQAIAWFYAATQGQWTIARGSHAFAKSFAGDFGGFLQSLTAARAALRLQRARAAFCGAVDCCLTPYARAIMESASPHEGPLGEGGAFFWVEEFIAAAADGCQPGPAVCITAWGSEPLPTPSDSRATIDALASQIPAGSRLLVVLDSARDDDIACLEERVIEALRSNFDVSRVLRPRERFGHLLSGALPVDLAVAAHLLGADVRAAVAGGPGRPDCALLLSISPYRLLHHVVLRCL